MFYRQTDRQQSIRSQGRLSAFCSPRWAFTLAEVLIVIGIIGIIAELTIPALLNNIKDATYNAAAKASYSNFSQAVTMFTVNDIDISDVTADLNANSVKFRDNLCTVLSCIKKDGEKEIFTKTYKYYKGDVNVWPSADLTDWAAGVLKNGESFEVGLEATCVPGTQCGWIRVDTNGLKSPNMFGFDVLDFGINNRDGNYYLVPATGTCTINGHNNYCTALRITNPDSLP